MKFRWNPLIFSALLMSACLVTLIPGALKFASTWKELYLEVGDYRENNLLMPLGLFSLGFQIIGLVVLWTGFVSRRKTAWFIMLLINCFFVFPPSTLTLLITKMQMPSFQWSAWFSGIREGSPTALGMAIGVTDFLLMSIALLVPIRKFFGRRQVDQQIGGDIRRADGG